jgi:hypothetical protein
MRAASSATWSINDVCVVTLPRVVIDVAVALCAIGGAATTPPGPGRQVPEGWRRGEVIVRARRGEEALSTGLCLEKWRSVEEIELE